MSVKHMKGLRYKTQTVMKQNCVPLNLFIIQWSRARTGQTSEGSVNRVDLIVEHPRRPLPAREGMGNKLVITVTGW